MNQQRTLLLKICEMQSYLGWFTGALLGAYYADPELLSKINKKDNELQKLVRELQDMIMEEKNNETY